MAVMHPEDLENYECTATEREMYEAFRDRLPQKYQVFYSIRWFETSEENKRVDIIYMCSRQKENSRGDTPNGRYTATGTGLFK